MTLYGNRRQPTRRLPAWRRRDDLLYKTSCRIGRGNCPKDLVVMGPRVLRLRSAGPPHGMGAVHCAVRQRRKSIWNRSGTGLDIYGLKGGPDEARRGIRNASGFGWMGEEMKMTCGRFLAVSSRCETSACSAVLVQTAMACPLCSTSSLTIYTIDQGRSKRVALSLNHGSRGLEGIFSLASSSTPEAFHRIVEVGLSGSLQLFRSARTHSLLS